MTATAAPSPAPIVRTIEVAVPPARAFELFTARMSDWWPLSTHSVFGAEAESLRLAREVGGEIVEHRRSGETSVWGTVVAWEDGVEVGFTWHPGADSRHATQVHVRFEPVPVGTHVGVVHDGWEQRADEPDAYRMYQADGVGVLGMYAAEAAT